MTKHKRIRNLERAVACDTIIGASVRKALESAPAPFGPPWPVEHDDDWQEWIRAHWPANAVAELQAWRVAAEDMRLAAYQAVAEALQDNPDAEILPRLEEWGFDVPPATFEGSVVEWLGEHHDVSVGNMLKGAISRAVYGRRHSNPRNPDPAARAQQRYLEAEDLALRIGRHEVDRDVIADLAARYVSAS